MDAVVVTFNSERELAGLVDCASTWTNFERVVVVDNCSTDETCAIAQAAAMVVIKQERNTGFGAAANVGVRHTRGPHFALLNPDIRFTTAAGADELASQLADPQVALVGPRLILPTGATQDSARAIPSPLNLLTRRFTRGQQGAVSCGFASHVPWVVGGCVVIRRAAFEAVGGFDPRYFLYFEDVDLCVRLWEQGWSVRFDPTVVVDHEYRAASRGRLWSSATRDHIRSAVRFYLGHPRYLAHRGESLPPPAIGRRLVARSIDN